MSKPNTTKASPAKAASPARRKGKQISLKDKLTKKSANAPTITAYGTHEIFGTDLYLFTNGPNDDGFLKLFGDYCKGTLACAALEKQNFTSLLNRRVPGSDNTIMLGKKGFWRKVIVRHPKDGLSTPENRAEGLAVLKKCFLTTAFSKFPPADIETFDATDEDNPKALDMFLQDHDIVEIIKEQLDEADLNREFYDKYTDCANLIWSGKDYPAFALSLGFP
jgi:hypothetical protein